MKIFILVISSFLFASSAFAKVNQSPLAINFSPTPTPRPGPEVIAEVKLDLAAVPAHPLSFKEVSIIDNGIVQIARVQKTGNIMITKLAELTAEELAYVKELSDDADSDKLSKSEKNIECLNKVTTTYFGGFSTGHLHDGRYIDRELDRIAEQVNCDGRLVISEQAGKLELVRILDALLKKSGAN